MVIKRSSAREVASLLGELERGPEAAREAAAARLSVIGTRAVEGLLTLVATTRSDAARVAALGALEAIADPRAEDEALRWLQHGDSRTALAAAGTLRRLLDGRRGTEVLDRLTAILLEPANPEASRVAALGALGDLPASVTGPVRQRLATDQNPAVREAATWVERAGTARDPAALLDRAASGALPDTPGELKDAVLEAGGESPLPTLHRLVGCVRAAEEAPGVPEARRREWTAVRAAVHLALAQRGSTVALYDLREMVERGGSGPVEVLSALERIGDAASLEAIAAAHARLAGAEAEAWWRDHLATAFRAILARERLTERHAVVRRIKARWPASAAELLPRRRPESGIRNQDSAEHP